jgi:AcrR family transcriptional regulator
MSSPGSRRTTLNRARVLEAAVELADRDGIEALTVRRLADVLGVHPTSLYNHVASKDALLAGVVERLFDEAELPSEVASWEEWVVALAAALRASARAHPGAFFALTRVPATSARPLQQTELALDAFLRGGFTLAEARDAVAGVSLALLGLALNESPGDAEVISVEMARAARLPRVLEALAAEGDGDGGHWDLIVDVLVIGLRCRHEAVKS